METLCILSLIFHCALMANGEDFTVVNLSKELEALNKSARQELSARGKDKSILRYGFHKTDLCMDYERAFLCVRKCLDIGYDVAYADKRCKCTCYRKKEKAKFTPSGRPNRTKYREGTPTTKLPAWAQPPTPEPPKNDESVDNKGPEDEENGDGEDAKGDDEPDGGDNENKNGTDEDEAPEGDNSTDAGEGDNQDGEGGEDEGGNSTDAGGEGGGGEGGNSTDAGGEGDGAKQEGEGDAAAAEGGAAAAEGGAAAAEGGAAAAEGGAAAAEGDTAATEGDVPPSEGA